MIDSKAPFPIVGIGASAGGLEAFQQLLAPLPSDLNMAFIVIQHLDPTHSSALPDILMKSTSIPVLEIKEAMEVKRNHIYIIPSNTELSITSQGHLHLLPRSPEQIPPLPINSFFSSLAKAKQELAIGVILSGTGSDGSLGIQAIKNEGGITFAQEEISAKFDQMPFNAIDTGCVDFILPPAKIAKELIRIGRHPYLRSSERTPSTITTKKMDPVELGYILQLLQKHFKVDFGRYKENTIKRRILKRMLLLSHDTLESYADFLSGNSTEMTALYNDILINVTGFFRDAEAFQSLKDTVFPTILNKKENGPVRIWVPGCSTGEEVYSIAISLLEFLGNKAHSIPIQIFATDISERSIETARAGSYPSNKIEGLSQERLRRFFIQGNGSYQISKSIRDICVFSIQNVTADTPFSRMDLISCRNLLIYLGPSLQKRVIPIFHYALNNPGYLFLGSAETIGGFGELFELVDKKHNLYSKKISTTRTRFEFPFNYRSANSPLAPLKATLETAPDIKKNAERYLLNHYVPVGVVINENLEILHTIGDIGPYLTLNQGTPSLNIAKMAREGLASDLRVLIQRAKKETQPLKSAPLHIDHDGIRKEFYIEVVSLSRNPEDAKTILVLFKTLPAHSKPQLKKKTAHKQSKRIAPTKSSELEHELSIAKNSLHMLKETLQSSLEGQEAANEELQSANEEILSSNEELQSTNEELETAKEELQSSNEELITVNDELQNRNNELNITNNDLVNLLSSVRIPLVMLGSDLCIRRFTPLSEKTFNLIPTDIGRPITNITPNFSIPNMTEAITQVMETAVAQEIEVKDHKERWYSLKIHPYRRSDNKIDGAVLILVDIHILKQSRDMAESIVQSIREPLVALDPNLRVITANRSFYETYKVSPEDTENHLIYELGNKQWNIPKLRELLIDILPNKQVLNDYEVEHEFEHIGKRTMLLNARSIHLESKGMNEMILLAIDDITERKRNENIIRSALHEKEVLIKEIHHRVKNNLNIVSSLLELQAGSITDEVMLDYFKDSQSRIRSIALIHEKLYQSSDLAQIDFGDYVDDLVLSIFNTFGIDSTEHSIHLDIENIRLSVNTAMPCSLIINELVSNSLLHAFPNNHFGEISISMKSIPQQKLELTVSDNGIGLPKDFDFRKSKSLGLQLVITLVNQLKGEIELLPEEVGTSLRIRFDRPSI